MIVEWDAHLFSYWQEPWFPWHPQAHYVPAPEALDKYPLTTYLTSLDARGIDRAVIVQPEPYGDDHSLVLYALALEPTRIKTTCLLFPHDPQAPAKLEQLVAGEPRIVALRLHAVRGYEPYFQSFREPEVRRLCATAARLGLVLEVHISPNYAAEVAELAAEYPDTPILVDHLAEPQLGSAEEYADVLALGRRPNAVMKLSGLGHCSRQPEPHMDLKPLLQRVAAAFGPQRLVWSGGDPANVDLLLDSWTPAERALVKGDTLARLARFC